MIFKHTLIKAAKLAGAIQLKHFGKLKHVARHFKAHHEMVTYVDKLAEGKIISTIKRQYSQHAIISEESPDTEPIKSEYTWVIDPLDGTTNFAIGNPLFGVSIAVLDSRGAYEGVFYFPVMKRLLYCLRGHGTYEDGKRVHVSRSKIHDSIISVNITHNIQASHQAMDIMKRLRPEVNNIRVFGSSAFAYSSVAVGAVDGLVMVGHQNRWDVNPGMLMVTEAGGQATNMKGGHWSASDNGVVLSNGKVHAQLVRKLK